MSVPLLKTQLSVPLPQLLVCALLLILLLLSCISCSLSDKCSIFFCSWRIRSLTLWQSGNYNVSMQSHNDKIHVIFQEAKLKKQVINILIDFPLCYYSRNCSKWFHLKVMTRITTKCEWRRLILQNYLRIGQQKSRISSQ